MAEDRWYRDDLPLLECVSEHGSADAFLSVGEIADGTGIDPNRSRSGPKWGSRLCGHVQSDRLVLGPVWRLFADRQIGFIPKPT